MLPYQLHQKLNQQKQKQKQGSLSSSPEFDFKVLQKTFWYWDKEQHLTAAELTNGQCCWNHVVGLPIKDGKEYPLFNYEKILFDALIIPGNNSNNKYNFQNKHLWVKKATGLGITEFFLRLLAWLCTSSDSFRNSQACIITGPNIDLATKLIKRLKLIFEPKLGLIFSNKETALELNGCMIEAYPSNHIDSFRSLTNPKFILIDEGDFLRKSEQEDVRHVSERYIGKSDPYLVMVSTPNNPGGLFERIEKEPEDSCIYKRLKLDYRYGLNRIYTKDEIDRAKKSPGFEREYNLKYLGKIGNIFSPMQIDRVVELGEQFKAVQVNPYALHSLGCDPGFGSSKTAIVLTEFLKEEEKIRVLFAEEFDHANPQDMVNLCHQLHVKYPNTWFHVDGANRGFITELKVIFGEETDWEPDDINPEDMRVIPVNFLTEHKTMLSNLHLYVSKDYLAIPEKFDKLIVSLRTASANEYSLDKEATSYDDLFDSLRLSMRSYKIS